MPPSPVVVDVPAIEAPRPSASLAGAESEPKLMPAMVIGIFSVIGFLRVARAERDVGAAFLAIAFERIAADRSAEKQEIVEMRQLALGAEAADVIDAGRGRAMDFGDRVFVERRRGARRGRGAFIVRAHQYCPALSTWK